MEYRIVKKIIEDDKFYYKVELKLLFCWISTSIYYREDQLSSFNDAQSAFDYLRELLFTKCQKYITQQNFSDVDNLKVKQFEMKMQII